VAREPKPEKAPSGQAADELAKYRQKRDPLRTNEPFGAERKHSGGSGTWAGRFVVHLHSARRRHYDVRLQIGRALKSFAVPRGPSLDPDERRLAVMTEDHPLEYVDFEDVIPEGNYGAGPMIAWDVGRVTYLENSAEQGVEKGKIDFVLHGLKLRGRFGLVKTKRGEGNEWLLLKKRDEISRKEGDILVEAPESVFSGLTVDEWRERDAFATRVEARAAELGALARPLEVARREPMLAALSGARLDEADRLYELKLDGVRIVADKQGKQVTLRYRNGGVCSQSYPEIVRAMAALAGERIVLDGEIVAFDARGRPRFQRLGSRIQARRALDIARAVAETPVKYLVFDLLAFGTRDLTELPLFARKELLALLIHGKGLIQVLDHFEGRGAELFAFCEAQELEGVVAKRKASPYRFGPRRTEDWVKIKSEREDDFVVVGFVSGQGARSALGALCVASFENGALVYRGRVGSGLDAATIDEFARLFAERAQATPSVVEPIPDEARAARWLRPDLVVSVRYAGFSDDHRLRHPVFRGLRADVAPEDCTARPSDDDVGGGLSSSEKEAEGDVEAEVESAPEVEVRAGVTSPGNARRPDLVLSNKNKVFWAAEGYTKGDLLSYYESISGVLLPFLAQRPVVLVRHPDGIAGKSFYQWNVPAGTPDWIRRMTLEDPDDPGKVKHVFLIDDVDSLLHVINLGCIPLHVLAFRERARNLCDFITFDLDLGDQAFARGIEIALTLREILDDLGLPAYVKTSGQGGLHVLTPLGPGIGFDTAKLLVELIGRIATARHPSFATMERRVDKRSGKLYLDTGQTGPSRTIVSPYSVRAYPGATVSTPLFWDELSGALDPARLTIMTVPARLLELSDPFTGFLDERPDVPEAIRRLEKLLNSR
jgi:bifunctional non-homologous end joining protein LigD